MQGNAKLQQPQSRNYTDFLESLDGERDLDRVGERCLDRERERDLDLECPAERDPLRDLERERERVRRRDLDRLKTYHNHTLQSG